MSQFTSRREAHAYLAGDRIPCLICGKAYRAVCHHARLAHGVSAREYKQRFGLPLYRGVAAQDAREAWAASIRRSRSEGLLPDRQPPGGAGQQPAYAADLRRVDPSVAVAQVIEALRAGQTITEACAAPGGPRWTVVHQALKRDAALQLQFDAAIEALPFGLQARMKKLGRRFDEAVAAQPDRTCADLAGELGVSDEAVRRSRKRTGVTR